MTQRSETRTLVIVGSGGFARETLDVVEDLNASGPIHYQVVGIVDSGPSEINLERFAERGIPFLGSDKDWFTAPTAEFFTVAIGAPAVRRKLVPQYCAHGRPVTLIHPTAVIGRRTTVGEGVTICAGAVISSNVSIGDYVHINPNATIGHDATIDNFVSLNPGSIISGAVHLATGVLVGAGAVVLENLSVGEGSTVGAAACVTREIAAGQTVVGVPAHSLRGRS